MQCYLVTSACQGELPVVEVKNLNPLTQGKIETFSTERKELFFFLFFLSAVHLRAYSKRLSGLRVSTQHTLSFHLWKESTRHRRLRCVRSYRRLSNLSNLSVFCRSSRLLNTIKYLICPCDANILANMVITQKSCTVGMIMIMLIC